MAWLAKDDDGTEGIYRLKPQIIDGEWSDAHWNDDVFIRCDEDRIFDSCIVLPKGSIEKLIGKDLTFEDGPIEIL